MKPPPFTYHRPADVDAAVLLLGELCAAGHHPKVLAGGQSMLPLLTMRLASPSDLVDINALAVLDVVRVTAHDVAVGALVRHRALERHEGAHDALPLLRQALTHVAHPTIRNRGTSVGSICHADPSAELPAVLTLLGGHLVARSVRGTRTVAAADLFVGPLESSLAPDELALEAVFPLLEPGTGTAVVELARRHGDYAMCGVVAAVSLDDGGRVARARCTYVSAGDTIEPVDLSDPVAGADPGVAPWELAAELARASVRTDGDIHASAAYRSQLVAVLTERALREAAGRAAPLRVAA